MDNSQQGTGGDDSDNDVVTDFLNSNCNNKTTGTAINSTNGHLTYTNKIINNPKRSSIESQNYCIPIINAPAVTNNNIINNNMIPIINVTPHSPASVTKYINMFEDTLNQLQNIRESVVQMKNASMRIRDSFSHYGIGNSNTLSASLPDLSAHNRDGGVGGSRSLWSTQQQYLLQTNRRKSWTAVDDLTVGDCTYKSVSLSSLDSEEQESMRLTEQRRRTARNSTGGISTHSLNEAELVRDFERISAKRNLATEIISRIPLQKSISTSSIVAKEENKSIGRHLTDSEDENQSLLRAHAKIEVYDNVEKRRKRGSLFFRKKKDKAKMKALGQTICDACDTTLLLSNVKDHQLECKSKKSFSQKIPLSVGLRRAVGVGDKNELGHDFYDGHDHGAHFSEDTPLIRSEFLNDPPVEVQDLGADPTLGIALEEHDSWSPSVPKEVLKSLKEKQIKRQEHIYEFIMTEKHHCQTVLVMQKVFVESLERHFPALNTNTMFPRLAELTELHITFLAKLRQKQREQYVVDSIADILLDFFSLEKASHLRLAYGEFCANHRSALEQFKTYLTGRDENFAEWYKHCLTNPLLKKKGIPECILFVTQRLTKYPLLIEPLLKSAREDKLEYDKLQHALNLVKALLVDVDACVAEKELKERQIEIFNRVDLKSFSIYKNKPFRKTDIGVESRRRLKFEGQATLMQGRSKMQLVLVVVLTDCLCFLVESSHNKYTFFTPDHKAGVVPLQKLLIREKAGSESPGIYIISSNPTFPEMYELKVQKPKDKNVWIQSIRQAVIECPSSDVIETEDLTAEEKLRIGVNKRELIEKMRQKDIELAILMEEKIVLQLNLLKEQKNFEESHNVNSCVVSAANFLAAFGTYKNLVGVDCDTTELWKRVINNLQDVSQLASTVYTAATGLPVSRSISSVGEKQSEFFSSPTLPKRAETFAGFDEKRAKNIFSCRDVPKVGTLQVLSPRLQELEEKREPKSGSSVPASGTVAASSNIATPAILQSSNDITEQMLNDELTLKDHNYASLQIAHHLNILLNIISQQMTTIYSLQQQLALYRESPRTAYTHNDQLEELRNLQDKLQEEKTAWLRQKEQQEIELDEKRTQQTKLQEQIKAEQEDIKQQREQLYRKMEVLSSQGFLLSPNTPLIMASSSAATVNINSPAASNEDNHDSHEGYMPLNETMSSGNTSAAASTVDRRKDKWRTASTISKTPPVNLLSATNAPKINQTSVKQKIPIKLSSLSSSTSTSATSSNASKIDKSASFSSSTFGSATPHYQTAAAAGVTQLFPLKLADKRTMSHNTQIVPQHSRTGSSPAIIQHPVTPGSASATSPSTAGFARTDSMSAVSFSQRHYSTPTSSRNIQTATTPLTSTAANKSSNAQSHATRNSANLKPEEEEIYF